MRKSIHNIQTSIKFLENSYYIIQSSGVGDIIFHYENYGMLPITFILETLRQINEYNKLTAQFHSYTAANLTFLVYSYMAGEDADKSLTPNDFLPGYTKDGKDPLDDKTFTIIDREWDTLPAKFKEYIVKNYNNRLN